MHWLSILDKHFNATVWINSIYAKLSIKYVHIDSMVYIRQNERHFFWWQNHSSFSRRSERFENRFNLLSAFLSVFQNFLREISGNQNNLFIIEPTYLPGGSNTTIEFPKGKRIKKCRDRWNNFDIKTSRRWLQVRWKNSTEFRVHSMCYVWSNKSKDAKTIGRILFINQKSATISEIAYLSSFFQSNLDRITQ